MFGAASKGVQEWGEGDGQGRPVAAYGARVLLDVRHADEADRRQGRRAVTKLTELGADLASFYNTDVSAALDAIRSGIVGESEPLRRYGVLLSETRVQAKALADTHKQPRRT